MSLPPPLPFTPQTQQSRSPFINADGAYLLACANARKSYIRNNDLIGVVTSYFPSTPYSKYQARFVGQPEVGREAGRQARTPPYTPVPLASPLPPQPTLHHPSPPPPTLYIPTNPNLNPP